ncbi:hypothetical protein ABZ915_33680 [Streptomyces sp. NPDC046915]|uniref:hypothetical protein n=1 Tax=Streptomyces sp. NPDC046915 TaxID=3155257 RepID=UPI0033DF9A1F
MTSVRNWITRVAWAVLAVPASAIVTAGAWGIAYGVANTPNWWNPLVVGFGAMLALAGLLALVGLLMILLEDWHDREYGKLEIVAAVCVALTTWTFCSAVHQQALHDRGRAVQAVVASLHPTEDEFGGDTGNAAVLKDSSGRTLSGQIDAGRLAVGDTVTATVDPRGKYGVQVGSPPQAPERLWELAAVLAALQALLCAAIGFSAVPLRSPRPKQTNQRPTVSPAS